MDQAVLEQNVGLDVNPVVNLLVGQAVGTEVHPQAVGAFGTGDFHLGHFLLKEVDGPVDVAVDVLGDLIHPLVALFVGGDLAGDGEGSGQGHGVVLHDGHIQLGILNDGVGAGQAGHIEALVDAYQADGVCLVDTGLQEGGILDALAEDVAVDLVGDDEDAVLFTDFGNSADFLGGPDTAHGVMGVAEDQQGGVGIGGLLLQQIPVDGVVAVVVDQMAADNLVAPLGDILGEMAVDRVHDDDALAGLCVHMGHMGQGAEGAVGVDDLIGLNLPVVAVGKPAAQSGEVPGVGNVHGVAVHLMVGNPVHGPDDGLGRLQVHVGGHHGDGVLIQAGAVHTEGGGQVGQLGQGPLHGVGTPAVNDGIKIVAHMSSFLSF